MICTIVIGQYRMEKLLFQLVAIKRILSAARLES